MKDKTIVWVIVAILLLTMITIVFMAIVITTSSENPLEKECTTICNSHNENYDKYTHVAYSNAVCYCKSATGQINTYVM